MKDWASVSQLPEFEAHLEKQVYARLQRLLNNPQLVRIWEKFGGHVFRRSSVLYGLEDFLRENGVRGRNCLEIGTCNGITAVILSNFFEHVVSVDLYPSEHKRAIVEHLGIQNIMFLDIASNSEKDGIAGALHTSGGIDMAFLDGDHAKDTQLDWDVVKYRTNCVLFHEAWPAQKPVWNLVSSLPPSQVTFGAFNMALWRK